jgi:mitochondrial import inner membrane translocase subunit TIM23
MLTPTTTFALRFASAGTQRAALTTAFAKPAAMHATCPCYTPTTAARPFSTARPLGILAASIPRDAFRPVTAPSPLLSRIICRAQSTTSNATSSGAAGEAQRLDWNSFFKLRKTRRRWQLAFSVVMLGVSGAAGAGVLASGIADPIVAQIPLEPFLTLGFMVMGFAALGWLVGPSIGSAAFNALNRQWKKQITLVWRYLPPDREPSDQQLTPWTQKEIEFFARVKKNRVDPSASGASNPGTTPLPQYPPNEHIPLTLSSPRLLRREHLQRRRLPPVAEGPACLQQEAHSLRVGVTGSLPNIWGRGPQGPASSCSIRGIRDGEGWEKVCTTSWVHGVFFLCVFVWYPSTAARPYLTSCHVNGNVESTSCFHARIPPRMSPMNLAPFLSRPISLRRLVASCESFPTLHTT